MHSMAVNLNRVTQQQVSEATQTLPAPRFLISCSLLPHFSVCVPLPAGIGTPPPTAPYVATKHREIYPLLSHVQWHLHTQVAVQGHTPSYLLLHVHGLKDFKD